jgi:hypothetical protein
VGQYAEFNHLMQIWNEDFFFAREQYIITNMHGNICLQRYHLIGDNTHLNGGRVDSGQNWYRLKPNLADGRERLSKSRDWLIVASWYMFALSSLRSSPEMNGVPNPVLTKHTCTCSSYLGQSRWKFHLHEFVATLAKLLTWQDHYEGNFIIWERSFIGSACLTGMNDSLGNEQNNNIITR